MPQQSFDGHLVGVSCVHVLSGPSKPDESLYHVTVSCRRSQNKLDGLATGVDETHESQGKHDRPKLHSVSYVESCMSWRERLAPCDDFSLVTHLKLGGPHIVTGIQSLQSKVKALALYNMENRTKA